MRKPKVGGPPAGEGFCWYTREMLLAPAFSEASINCRRLINALEVENMSHAGTENGNLLMPYNQLERWWHIPRRLIRQTIDGGRTRSDRGTAQRMAAVLCEVDAEHVPDDVSADSRGDSAAMEATDK
jgi:hypothetical protein